MKLIATQTVTTAQPSIEFTSIPGNFTDLYVLMSARSSRSSVIAEVLISFNGNTSNFTNRRLFGNGSTVESTTNTQGGRGAGFINGNDLTANTFGNYGLYIPNYAGATNKSVSIDSVNETNGTEAHQAIFAVQWANTSPITSTTFTLQDSTNFQPGTVVSLYGIGGAGDANTPKATGGMIQKIGDYWVHTFTASGTFTPTAPLSNVEYLVVAGGGGGGGAEAGAGGAGGYRSSVVGESSGGGASAESRLSLAAGTAYTVTIGAGGASRLQLNSFNGTDSVFGSITSLGGGGGAYNAVGLTGGSGGGSSYQSTGGSGTTNQGFAGGGGFIGGNWYGGGGGGASAVGQAGQSSKGGNGGNGVASSITGSSVTRAGGGGAGTNGAGGAGGGGAGSTGPSIGSSGTVNTGGGGGGGFYVASPTTFYAGGSGGSGIVVVRYLA